MRLFPQRREITSEVFAEQAIDFTRHDIGSWLWWVIFPVLLLAPLTKQNFVGGLKAVVSAVLIRLVCGLILSAIAVTFVTAWHLWGPQYFIKLRVDHENLALRYHWLKEETVIPLKEVTKLSIVRSGTMRRPCGRVRIETTGGTFRSFGFGRLDEDQVAVLDVIRQKIAIIEASEKAK